MDNQELLLEETRKRMQRLYEYSFYYNGMTEDGEEQNPNAAAPAPGGDPNAMGAPAPGGDPNAMGAPVPGDDPNAMGAPAPGDEVNGANLAPNAGMNNNDPSMGNPDMMGPDMGDQPGPDDNVVDITQLTDAQDEMKASQERTAEQLEDVDAKLVTLLNVVDKFTQALNANDEKINDLKREIQMRTPTEEETMNVRLNAGGNPFDQKPEEFWDKFRDINNHYNITANNEAPQYQIKKGDIENVNDRMIDRELDDIPRSLHEYFVR